MSQGVPVFGVWNKPNGEEIGFTGNFDMVRQVRRDKPYMDHIRTRQAMGTNPQLLKRPATSSGISERMRNEGGGEIWETQSAKDPTADFAPQIRTSRRPPCPIERRDDLPPLKPHNRIGEIMKNERSEYPVQYDKGEIWETHSAGDHSENFVPQTRQSRKPPVPIERRHDLSHIQQHDIIGEGMRNGKSQFPAGYDKGEIWETQSAGDPSENFVPQYRQSQKTPVPVEGRHDFSHTKQPNVIGERTRNENLQFPVGYARGEIWETQSDRSPVENFAPQIRQPQRPTVPNERRRHDLSHAKPQNILTGQDDPRGRHERPRTGTLFGSAGGRKSPPEARHHRIPSSSSDGSRRGLLSSRDEEFMAKETNAMYRKPKGHTAPTYGKWNVDPNCTQEYTMQFAAVRNQKENRVEEPSVNPTPKVQAPPPPQRQKKYYMDTRQQKQNKGKQTSCFGFLFPQVKRM